MLVNLQLRYFFLSSNFFLMSLFFLLLVTKKTNNKQSTSNYITTKNDCERCERCKGREGRKRRDSVEKSIHPLRHSKYFNETSSRRFFFFFFPSSSSSSCHLYSEDAPLPHLKCALVKGPKWRHLERHDTSSARRGSSDSC